MLLIHMDTNYTAKYRPEQISSDYKALEARLKWSGAQVIFSSILQVENKDLGTNTLSGNECMAVHMLPWGGFGFLNHGMQFCEGGQLGRDGVHPTKKRKNILSHQLTNLVMRALN